MKKTSSIETNSIKKIKVTDVCPAYYGAIEIINGNEIVVIFIKKNTPLPCSVSKSYFTEYENQDSINIRITESATSEDNPDFVNILQEKVIQLPPISNAGYEIKVTFNVDNNGVLHASILNVESGEKSDITIAGIESNLTDQFTVNDEVQEVE
ncbi:Hsp70 family protein, partial [Candidatus Pseudothioglobus singularis]